MTARRLLLSTTALEMIREGPLPPGFGLEPTGTGSTDAAVAELRALGVSVDGAVHPAVAGDLEVLGRPELAVVVQAAVPGVEVHACAAVSGVRGAGLLRTGDTAVQLSAFPAVDLAVELARVVPTPVSGAPVPAVEELPLDVLLDGAAGRLSGRATGTLQATVLGRRGLVGSVQWVWDGAGWIGLEALPSRAGRPWVRLVPVTPGELSAWLAPLVATAAA